MHPSQIGLWFVCALGSTSFAATVRPTWRRAALCAAAYIAAAGWGSDIQLDSSATVGIAAAAGAAHQLVYKPSPLIAAMLAGLLAGTGQALLMGEGAHAALGVLLFAAPPVIASWLATGKPGFAPARLRDEALFLTCIGSLAAATAPGVIDGWRAAVSLSAQGGQMPAAAVPVWALMLPLAAVAGGALVTLWSRR
ncbi:MAG: hypothetical protein HYY76_00805 [Acidobacteria bacterium]|nr:hypothetical protein [Acidobacteriota bacterium]